MCDDVITKLQKNFKTNKSSNSNVILENTLLHTEQQSTYKSASSIIGENTEFTHSISHLFQMMENRSKRKEKQ